MDAIEKAKEAVAKAEDYREVELAQAYAAIAQAEAMHLIAKRLEQWLSVQGVLPEFFEAVNRAKIQDDDGSWQEYQEFKRQHTVPEPPSPLDNF